MGGRRDKKEWVVVENSPCLVDISLRFIPAAITLINTLSLFRHDYSYFLYLEHLRTSSGVDDSSSHRLWDVGGRHRAERGQAPLGSRSSSSISFAPNEANSCRQRV